MTADTVEQLINEIAKIKTQMNSTELQLYEANEKIAELIENVSEIKTHSHFMRIFVCTFVCVCVFYFQLYFCSRSFLAPTSDRGE